MFLWLENNTYAAACSISIPCPTWLVCDYNLGICHAASNTFWTVQAGGFCTQPLDCKAWLTCLANKCITDPNAWNTTVGTFCSDTILCPGWKICVGNQCITDPATINADCSKCTKLPLLDYAKWCDSATQDQKSCSNDIYCCPKALWTACHPPYGWELNVFWMCWCPDGSKDVDWTCKLCSEKWVCCGVELNTSVPFIGKCIEDVKTNQWADETSVTWATAFPTLMWSLTKILVTLILITSFVLIIIGGIMIATGNPSGWRKMIINVVIGIALLGASGVILRLINPNFFG